jgi:hypothetical protein
MLRRGRGQRCGVAEGLQERLRETPGRPGLLRTRSSCWSNSVGCHEATLDEWRRICISQLRCSCVGGLKECMLLRTLFQKRVFAFKARPEPRSHNKGKLI